MEESYELLRVNIYLYHTFEEMYKQLGLFSYDETYTDLSIYSMDLDSILRHHVKSWQLQTKLVYNIKASKININPDN